MAADFNVNDHFTPKEVEYLSLTYLDDYSSLSDEDRIKKLNIILSYNRDDVAFFKQMCHAVPIDQAIAITKGIKGIK